MTELRTANGSYQGDDRYLVVSTDGHCGPSLREQLRTYCPAAHLEVFDEYTAENEAQLKAGSNRYPGLTEDWQERRELHAQVAGVQDVEARIADLDVEGITAELIFHGALNGQPVPFSSTGLRVWSDSKYDALEPVGVHIYNRWLADFTAEHPDRLHGLAHIAIHDLEACIAEVEWAAEAGLKGVNLPAPRRDFPYYNDPYWDKLWAACQANEMVLCTHNGGGEMVDFDGVAGHSLVLMEANWFARRGIWMMIFGGVFERYPGLKYLITESFGDWVLETLRDMDSSYLSAGHEDLRAVLPKKPSEYFMTNCYVAASFMSRREAELARDNDYLDRMLWGADYPHVEGCWPRTRLSLRKSFADFAPKDVSLVLGETAADVLGIDRERLQPTVQRIGPTVDEVATPLEANPEFVGTAFREIGKFA